MAMSRTLLLFAIALTSAFAAAQEYTIKRQPKVGDSIRYQLKAELDLGTLQAVMTGISTEKVTKVEANGSFEIESTSTEGKVEIEGGTQPVKQPGPMLSTYGAMGELVSLKGQQIDSSVYRMANLNAFRAPDKAIKVGDSWTRELAADPKTGVVPAKATFTLEAAETIGEIAVLKFKYAYTEVLGAPGGATAEGFMWIDPKDGSLVKSELTIKNAPFPQSPVPINAKLTATRI